MEEQVVHDMFKEVRGSIGKVHEKLDAVILRQGEQAVNIARIQGVCNQRKDAIDSNKRKIANINEKGCEAAGCPGVDKKRMAILGSAVGGGIAGAIFVVVKIVEYWPKIAALFR